MAQTYLFSFTAQKASRGDGFTTIEYGGPATRYAEERHTMTFKEAQAYLVEFAERQTKDCACSYRCHASRMPPGYNNAARMIYMWVIA